MRKVLGLAVGAAMMVAGPVQAAEWWYINSNIDDDIVFIDVESLKKRGSTRHFWYEVILSKPRGKLKSARFYNKTDCSRRTYANLSEALYDENQRHISSRNFRFPEEEPIVPETMSDHMRKFVCSDPSIWESELGAFRAPVSTRAVAALFHSASDAKK